MATGPQGVQGLQGPRGPQGLQGAQGLQGLQGLQGVKGEQGDRGPTGEQGRRGIQGIQGPRGVQGNQGAAGQAGVEGPTGVQGPRGLQGLKGDQGLQGTAGPTGPQGSQGVQGVQGDDGPIGPQGLQGPQGIQGIQGPQGVQGTAGPTGVQGAQGLQGPGFDGIVTPGPGRILTATGSSSTLVYAQSGFVYDAATGRVGLGVSSPDYQLHLSTDSAAKLSSSTWTVTSDARVKENIRLADLDACYEAVKALPLRQYSWNPQFARSDGPMLGFVAQEAALVFPGSVFQRNAFGMSDFLSLDADQIYKAMYGALCRVIADKEALEARVAALENASQKENR